MAAEGRGAQSHSRDRDTHRGPGSDWGVRLRIRGLRNPIDQRIFGIDAIQALQLGLKLRGRVNAEWQRGLLVVMQQVADRLAAL